MEKLPAQAKRMWAKTPGGGFGRSTPARESDTMLPLYVHMGDSAEVATKLWETWVPDGVKALIHPDQALAHRLFRFLAAVHDIGKATPAFQLKSEFLAEGIGLTMPFISKPSEIPHGLAGHWILCEQGFNKSVAVVVGGHHGIPPTASELERVSAYTKHTGAGMSEWREVQDALLQYACRLAGMAEHDLKQAKFELHVQALLTGLVIMTDWLASDESRFSYLPYPPVYTQAPSSRRAADAWESLGLPPYWSAAGLPDDIGSLFQARFGIETPRPLQLEAIRALSETEAPGIIVIEAPMGIGKTETALVAAEILAERTGRGGAFVGLPTMATSDAMFGRVKRWVDALASDADTDYSMFLAHGKSTLNDEYQGLIAELRVGDSGEESAVANEWLQGRKKGVLADFVVGTVDQLLFMALKTRHVVLRHLALANKVVIIDECHAYDAYMNCYLERALEWLGKYRTPVILLSATLPETTRRKLIDAYMGPSPRPGQGAPPCSENPAASGAHPPLAHKWAQPASPAAKPLWASNRAYPLITYSDGGEIRQAAVPQSGRVTEVSFEHLPDSALPDKLHSLLSGGGCAGIICNTVDRAQQTVQILKDHFAGTGTDIELIHARFVGADRMQKEKKLRGRLGPQSRTEDGSRPQRFIVVGTQVLEQSLDIDFDLLVSDIAPMDLLLQRVGRLHRHDRTRPEKLSKAMCFVTGIEDAAGWQFASAIEMVYSRYMLLNTLLLLPTAPDCVTLPDDISPLVQKAYTEPG
ncbi:MAG: CRISPR-associated helicase Cas3', partial [Clostridiales Family XIII bacterium]|nr:CRISPR-associated helicase Cas3' [Clostridiales Family XIII bacterium]